MPELESLLTENDIPLNLLPDFKFMGIQFKLQKEYIAEMNQALLFVQSNYLELFKALMFFQNKNEEIKIRINSAKNKKGITIQNSDLIGIVKEALIQYSKQKIGESLNQKDIPIHLKQFEGFIKKSGRGDRKHSSFGISILILKLYIQKYTEMKNKSERMQHAFIFRFLKLWGLIEIPDSWKEDNIRISLHKYLNSTEYQDYQLIRQRSQNP
jgi:hypothetical protein